MIATRKVASVKWPLATRSYIDTTLRVFCSDLGSAGRSLSLSESCTVASIRLESTSSRSMLVFYLATVLKGRDIGEEGGDQEEKQGSGGSCVYSHSVVIQ